jgi:hypothetical protein
VWGVYMSNEKQLVNIIQSKMISVYLHELFYLCLSVKRECEEIFLEAKIPEKGYMIQVSPVLHSRINSVLIYSANIKKLISTPENKGKKESTRRYQLRKQRESMFSEFLNGIEIKEINNNKVRNTIEHFEEYLDELNLELENETNEIKAKHNSAAYNMTFSEWQVINPAVYPLRLYIANEKKLYNFDWSIDIGKIYNESLEILRRVKTLRQFENDDDEIGGMLIPL